MLVDYIIVKLKKAKNESWDSLGSTVDQIKTYESKAGTFKSNFVKVEHEEMQIVEREAKPANDKKAEAEPEQIAKPDDLEAAVNNMRSAMQVSFLQLESSIFDIY